MPACHWSAGAPPTRVAVSLVSGSAAGSDWLRLRARERPPSCVSGPPGSPFVRLKPLPQPGPPRTAAPLQPLRAGAVRAAPRRNRGTTGAVLRTAAPEEILQLTQHAIERVVENSYWMPNWALKSLGATVDAERTTKSYGGKGRLSPFFSSAKSPETLLQPDISVGNCWAFQGSQGHVVIQLPQNIWPTAFTLWHVSKAVSPSGDVNSAPRDFAILGVDEDERETLLGLYVYDVGGDIAQTFHVQEKPLQSYKRIKMDVRSNWGNAEYTCVYQLEIHGNP